MLNNSLTNCEKAFPKITHKRSLTQTPDTKLKPPARPLVMLCFMIAKITGPTEKSKIILIARPCNNALIIKKIGDFIFGEDRKKLLLFINWYCTAWLAIHDAFCHRPQFFSGLEISCFSDRQFTATFYHNSFINKIIYWQLSNIF